MTPWTLGHVPQQIEALFAFVTVGSTASTSANTPPSAHAFRVGMALSA